MNVSAIRVNATRKVKALSRNLRFALDEDVFCQDASETLMLTGWVVHRTRRIRRVMLEKCGKVLVQGDLLVERPRVMELHPSYPDAPRAGFNVEIPALPTGTYQLSAELDNGKAATLAEIELEQRSQPKLLFMHIPKAAGSSVNQFLASHYRRSSHAVHIESNPDWHHDTGKIRKLDFISGHVPVPALARKLNLDDYLKVTVVREPYTQLVSHLAWIRHLSDPGEEQRLGRHPPYVQKLTLKLKATDLSEPAAISALCAGLEEREQILLDNCQVRYFCGTITGRPVSGEDLERSLIASNEFDLLGITGQLDHFLADVAAAMGWKKPQHKITENVASSYYGIDLKNSQIRGALEPLVRYDLRMFHHIESSSQTRESLRRRMKFRKPEGVRK